MLLEMYIISVVTSVINLLKKCKSLLREDIRDMKRLNSLSARAVRSFFDLKFLKFHIPEFPPNCQFKKQEKKKIP